MSPAAAATRNRSFAACLAVFVIMSCAASYAASEPVRRNGPAAPAQLDPQLHAGFRSNIGGGRGGDDADNADATSTTGTDAVSIPRKVTQDPPVTGMTYRDFHDAYYPSPYLPPQQGS